MSTLGMLVAYDDDGNVIATLAYAIQYDDTPERAPLGLVDFMAHEEAGGEHTDIWRVEGKDEDGTTTPARGSKVWPEWLGGRAHDYKVELEGQPGRKHIAALVHKVSGHRRERAVVDGAIAERIAAAEGQPADIRDLVGGPDRPLLLDASGRNKARVVVTRPVLPLASAGQPVDTPQMAPTDAAPEIP